MGTGGGMILAIGALLVGFDLGRTARRRGMLAAGAKLAGSALTGYAVMRVMYPVTQKLVEQTLGE